MAGFWDIGLMFDVKLANNMGISQGKRTLPLQQLKIKCKTSITVNFIGGQVRKNKRKFARTNKVNILTEYWHGKPTESKTYGVFFENSKKKLYFAVKLELLPCGIRYPLLPKLLIFQSRACCFSLDLTD